MHCLRRRRRRVRVFSSGRFEVQTAPCPKCTSFNTRAWKYENGAVFMRGCLTCGHRWDDDAMGATSAPASKVN